MPMQWTPTWTRRLRSRAALPLALALFVACAAPAPAVAAPLDAANAVRRAGCGQHERSRALRREARLDAAEGADFLMVKPALAYLDIIRRIKDASDLPIVCYNVSGEYALVKAAAEKGWLDGEKARDEMLLAFFRAGADAVITYFAHEAAAAAAAS